LQKMLTKRGNVHPLFVWRWDKR